MIIAFIIPFVLVILVKRKTGRQTRAVPSYFLLFGPSAILTFMFFHLFENSYDAIENSLSGRFKYDFHFYARILLGVLMASIASFLVRTCWQKYAGHPSCDRRIFLYMLLVAAVCLPLLPITPISNVPVFCCVISFTGLFFVRRKIKEKEMDRLPCSNVV